MRSLTTTKGRGDRVSVTRRTDVRGDHRRGCQSLRRRCLPYESINFIGRLVQLIEKDYTTIRLYEWADRGYIVYLVHVEEDGPGKRPRRTLYPIINTHFARATPRKGYTAEEVSRAYPEFDKGRYLILGYP